MVSILRLVKHPATLRTFADVSTSEVIASVSSVTFSGLVCIACLSPPPRARTEQPFCGENGTQVEHFSVENQPAVPSLTLLMISKNSVSCWRLRTGRRIYRDHRGHRHRKGKSRSPNHPSCCRGWCCCWRLLHLRPSHRISAATSNRKPEGPDEMMLRSEIRLVSIVLPCNRGYE